MKESKKKFENKSLLKKQYENKSFKFNSEEIICFKLILMDVFYKMSIYTKTSKFSRKIFVDSYIASKKILCVLHC